MKNYLAFSDDSKNNNGRYRGLALVTLTKENLTILEDDFLKILEESGVDSEFKWSKVRNAKYSFVANKIIDFVFKKKDLLCIDVLIWDTTDSRHSGVRGRDDNANLVRMYYHLVSNSLARRYLINDSHWFWYPDHQSDVDWSELGKCILYKNHLLIADLFNQSSSFGRIRLKNIVPSESHKKPLIQIADMFAGLVVFSWAEFSTIMDVKNSTQGELFSTKKDLAPGKREKSLIALKFNNLCKRNKLMVAFDSTKGFYSYDRNAFVNFWIYEAHGDYDKAPYKS